MKNFIRNLIIWLPSSLVIFFGLCAFYHLVSKSIEEKKFEKDCFMQDFRSKECRYYLYRKGELKIDNITN